jgi:hypothetical protein
VTCVFVLCALFGGPKRVWNVAVCALLGCGTSGLVLVCLWFLDHEWSAGVDGAGDAEVFDVVECLVG